MNKMKSNQSNSRHTTPKVDLHGLKFAKIVFRVINNYRNICFTAARIAEPFQKATCKAQVVICNSLPKAEFTLLQ